MTRAPELTVTRGVSPLSAAPPSGETRRGNTWCWTARAGRGASEFAGRKGASCDSWTRWLWAEVRGLSECVEYARTAGARILLTFLPGSFSGLSWEPACGRLSVSLDGQSRGPGAWAERAGRVWSVLRVHTVLRPHASRDRWGACVWASSIWRHRQAPALSGRAL